MSQPGRAVAGLLFVALLAFPAALGAQASPLLPPEHWAVEALWRVEALGLAPDYLAAHRSVPRREAARVLSVAAEQAAERGAPWAGLLAAWSARFEEEFSEYEDGVAEAETGARMLGSAAGAGFVRSSGRMSPGIGEFPPEVTGALPLPDQRDLWAGAELAARLAAPVSVSVSPALRVVGAPGEGESSGVEASLPRWEVDAAWRNWSLVVGRGEVGYGAAVGGGVLLSGSGTIDRVELATTRPFHLPGFLRRLGPIAFHTFLSRLPEDRHPGSPYFAGMRLSGRVHPRLTLAGQRATLLGGDRTPERISVAGLLGALAGQPGLIEDQIASVEARFHLPTERWLPASLYCEWGAEDTSGAFTNVPGVLCGTFLPALPLVPTAAAGVEYAYFGGRCCDNPPWYRHKFFPGGWAVEDATLGHPLGGEGSEWLGYLRASALEARLRLETRAFWRDRTGENLFVPGRQGESFGLAGEAEWRIRPNSELRLRAARESGGNWREARLSLSSTWFF